MLFIAGVCELLFEATRSRSGLKRSEGRMALSWTSLPSSLSQLEAFVTSGSLPRTGFYSLNTFVHSTR